MDIINNKSKNYSIRVTVRLSSHTVKMLDGLATENDVTRADVVREIINGRMEEYLNKVRYVDREQGIQILEGINELLISFDRIRQQLRYIGNNYNQEVKLMNIEKKYGDRPLDFQTINQKYSEIEQIEKECSTLKIEDVDRLINQFTDAVKGLEDVIYAVH